MRPSDLALGPRLKAAREGVPLIQARAAILLGVSVETLSNWERSKTQPLAGDLVGICTLYKISPLALLGMTTDKTLEQTTATL